MHLKEDFDVEGDSRSRPFQPQPDGVRVRVRGGHQANLNVGKGKDGDGKNTGMWDSGRGRVPKLLETHLRPHPRHSQD